MKKNNKDKWENGGSVIGGWEVQEYSVQAKEDWKNVKCGLIGFVVTAVLLLVVLASMAIGLWHMFGA